MPAIQTRAQSNWETVRSSGAVRFSVPVTTSHRLRCERLYFPAGLSMKEFSIFSVSFWLWTSMSRSYRLSGWSLPVPPLRAGLTLGIIPCRPILLLKTFAVALVLKTGTWRKHSTFLLNYMRILVHGSLETFHLGIVVLALALVFTLAVRPDIPSLLELMTEG